MSSVGKQLRFRIDERLAERNGTERSNFSRVDSSRSDAMSVMSGATHVTQVGKVTSTSGPGTYRVVKQSAVRESQDRLSRKTGLLELGEHVEVDNIMVVGDRVRGHIVSPMTGWVSVSDTTYSVIFMVPVHTVFRPGERVRWVSKATGEIKYGLVTRLNKKQKYVMVKSKDGKEKKVKVARLEHADHVDTATWKTLDDANQTHYKWPCRIAGCDKRFASENGRNDWEVICPHRSKSFGLISAAHPPTQLKPQGHQRLTFRIGEEVIDDEGDTGVVVGIDAKDRVWKPYKIRMKNGHEYWPELSKLQRHNPDQAMLGRSGSTHGKMHASGTLMGDVMTHHDIHNFKVGDQIVDAEGDVGTIVKVDGKDKVWKPFKVRLKSGHEYWPELTNIKQHTSLDMSHMGGSKRSDGHSHHGTHHKGDVPQAKFHTSHHAKRLARNMRAMGIPERQSSNRSR